MSNFLSEGSQWNESLKISCKKLECIGCCVAYDEIAQHCQYVVKFNEIDCFRFYSKTHPTQRPRCITNSKYLVFSRHSTQEEALHSPTSSCLGWAAVTATAGWLPTYIYKIQHRQSHADTWSETKITLQQTLKRFRKSLPTTTEDKTMYAEYRLAK